jgi:hypothetical protein
MFFLLLVVTIPKSALILKIDMEADPEMTKVAIEAATTTTTTTTTTFIQNTA